MSPDPVPRTTPAECAAYIADLTMQLEKLADRANLSLLAYLLSMAREEAAMRRYIFDEASGSSPRGADARRAGC